MVDDIFDIVISFEKDYGNPNLDAIKELIGDL